MQYVVLRVVGIDFDKYSIDQIIIDAIIDTELEYDRDVFGITKIILAEDMLNKISITLAAKPEKDDQAMQALIYEYRGMDKLLLAGTADSDEAYEMYKKQSLSYFKKAKRIYWKLNDCEKVEIIETIIEKHEHLASTLEEFFSILGELQDKLNDNEYKTLREYWRKDLSEDYGGETDSIEDMSSFIRENDYFIVPQQGPRDLIVDGKAFTAVGQKGVPYLNESYFPLMRLDNDSDDHSGVPMARKRQSESSNTNCVDTDCNKISSHKMPSLNEEVFTEVLSKAYDAALFEKIMVYADALKAHKEKISEKSLKTMLADFRAMCSTFVELGFKINSEKMLVTYCGFKQEQI